MIILVRLAQVLLWVQFVHGRGVNFLKQLQIVYDSDTLSRNLREQSVFSDSSASGLVYYNFYSNNDCTGSITYQTGVVSNTCLPSKDFGIPNNDSFIPAFEAFYISNLSENCQNSVISFYNDSSCTHMVRSNSLTAFQSCKNTANLGVNVLRSAMGFCSIGMALPITTTSYVLTEYLGDTETLSLAAQCNATTLNSFNAYPVNLCYGISNTSSVSYSCSSSVGTITMNQYYDSNTCQGSGGYNEVTLSITQTCSLQNNFTDSYGYILNSCLIVNNDNNDDGIVLSDGEIAGIAIGAAIAAAIIAFAILAYTGVGFYGIFGNVAESNPVVKGSSMTSDVPVNEMQQNPMSEAR